MFEGFASDVLFFIYICGNSIKTESGKKIEVLPMTYIYTHAHVEAPLLSKTGLKKGFNCIVVVVWMSQ